MNCWEILEIQPTSDVKKIKAAYAGLASIYHPEEEPEKFQLLARAFREACKAAQRIKEVQEAKNALGSEKAMLGDDMAFSAGNGMPGQEQPSFYIDTEALQEEEAEYDHPMLHEILARYRADEMEERAWSDFFTTEAFLDVFREEGFATKLHDVLIEEVESSESQYIKRPFLTALCIAYGIAAEGFKSKNEWGEYETISNISLVSNAGFSEIYAILSLMDYTEKPIIYRSGEQALRLMAVRDYFDLVASNGLLEMQQKEYLSDSLRRYQQSYHVQKIPKRYEDVVYYQGDNMIDRYEKMDTRLPNVIHYLEHYCTRYLDNANIAKVIFRFFGMQHTAMGSNKMYFEKIKDTLIKRYPSVTEEPGDRRKAGKAWQEYKNTVLQLRAQALPEKEKVDKELPLLDALFEDKDFRGCILEDDFARSRLQWMSFDSDLLIMRMIDYLKEHAESSTAHAFLPLYEQEYAKRVADGNMKAQEIMAGEDFYKNPLFWKYFFTFAFSYQEPYSEEKTWAEWQLYTRAKDSLQEPVYETLPKHFLAKGLTPWEWMKEFLGFNSSSGEFTIHREKKFTTKSGREVAITFHYRYVEYSVDGKLRTVPFLSKEELEKETGERFWLLLPLLQREDAQALCGESLLDWPAGMETLTIEEKLVNTLSNPYGISYDVVYRENATHVYGYYIDDGNKLHLIRKDAGSIRKLRKEVLVRILENHEFSGWEKLTSEELGEKLLIHLTKMEEGVSRVYFGILPDRIQYRTGEGSVYLDENPQTIEQTYFDACKGYHNGTIQKIEIVYSDDAEEHVPCTYLFLHEGDMYECLYFERENDGLYGIKRAFDHIPKNRLKKTDGSQIYDKIPFGLFDLRDSLFHPEARNIIDALTMIFSDRIAEETCQYEIFEMRCFFEANLFDGFIHKTWQQLRRAGGFDLEASPKMDEEEFRKIRFLPNVLFITDENGVENRIPINPTKRKLCYEQICSFFEGKGTKLTLSYTKFDTGKRAHVDIRILEVVCTNRGYTFCLTECETERKYYLLKNPNPNRMYGHYRLCEDYGFKIRYDTPENPCIFHEDMQEIQRIVYALLPFMRENSQFLMNAQLWLEEK